MTSLDDVWVIANFKETQLRDARRASARRSPSTRTADARSPAHVDSIAAATGATFSLLPADNASGNFVKVVQRVPVKIVLDDAGRHGAPLRPGMSVNATVYLE